MPELSPGQKPLVDRMPGILDREISKEADDAFGHGLFAHALRDLIESKTNQPPFSIGLLGGWGTGKSSIKSLYLTSLKQDRSAERPIRSERFFTITFNAWRFGGENIRRALLRTVFVELGGIEEDLMDKLFNQVQRPTLVARDWRSMLRNLYENWLWVGVQLISVLACLIFFVYLAKVVLGISDQWALCAILALGAIAGGSWPRFALDPKRFLVPRYTNVTRVELPVASAEQFEALLAGQLSKFKKQHSNCERVIVFVDDLDRLSAEEMVSGLDAVRALMEISTEGDDVGVVFVISCDEEKVAEALGNRRKKNGADLPGVIFNQTDARRYLDRIFQFRLDIPPAPRQDMRTFASECLIRSYPGLKEELRLHGSTLEEVVNRMIHVGVDNPRNAIQIVNSFSQAWWLSCRREWSGPGSSKPGGLSVGAVTQYPVALAALCSLKVDFPDFYAQLLEQPDLIQRFIDVFVDKAPIESLPDGPQLALRKYAKKDDGDNTWTLSPNCRPLRRFLSSLSGVPWPKSIQPLLLLAQDPITRRSGDIGRLVFDGLVSADSDSVLEVLGRDKDDLDLSQDQLQIIAEVLEDVDADTDDRRDRAYSTLAKLCGRFPAEGADSLIIPLARRLATSASPRYRTGISSIADLLPRLPDREQRQLAGVLVDDVASSGQLKLTLPSGESPSLDEAVDAVKSVIDAVLLVRAAHGLPEEQDTVLLQWLVTRHVIAKQGEQILPFSDLEVWMDRFEDSLTASLAVQYLQAATEALNSMESEADATGCLRRCKSILETQWANGEESRAGIYDVIVSLGGVPPLAAGELIQSFFRLHLSELPDAIAARFIEAILGRVSSFVHDEELDPVDADAVDLVVQMIGAGKTFPKKTYGVIATVAQDLSRSDRTAEQAVALVRVQLETLEGSSDDILTEWTSRIFTDLPGPCLDIVGTQLDHVSQVTESAVIAQMNTATSSLLTDPEVATRYTRFLDHIPDWKLKEPRFGPHIAAVLNVVSEHYSDLESSDVFERPLARAVTAGPPSVVGPGLEKLSRTSSPFPASCGALHRYLIGLWPVPSPDYGTYDSVSIFSAGKTSAEKNPAQSYAADILLSLQDMVLRGLPVGNASVELAALATALWPYHTTTATPTLISVAAELAIPEATKLATSLTNLNATSVESLERVWRAFGNSGDHSAEMAKSLLSLDPIEITGTSDGALETWLSVCGRDAIEVASQLVQDQSLADEQRLRSWKRIEYRLPNVSVSRLLTLLNIAVGTTADIEQSAISFVDGFRPRLTTQTDRFDVAKTLLLLLPRASTLESKRELVRILASIGNKAIARLALEPASQLSEEDLMLMFEAFPDDKGLKKHFQQ